MKRGVLTLSKQELEQLLTILDIGIFKGTQLFEKLNSASGTTEEEVKIFLSEDELESIMDEVGPPTTENQELNNALKKISELLISFRS